MTITLRTLESGDIVVVRRLWEGTKGVGLSEADAEPGLLRFLERNPGLSVVAEEAGQIVGAVLCGHDGRRGYLHHLAVSPARRGRGVGRALVAAALEHLQLAGIQKCHVFVYRHNAEGLAFWRALAWTDRVDLCVLSHSL